MSKEAVVAMIKAANQDPALKQRMEAADGYNKVVQIGAEKGYQFTEEELKSVAKEQGMLIEGSEDAELSEEALEAVAGGLFDGWRVRFW